MRPSSRGDTGNVKRPEIVFWPCPAPAPSNPEHGVSHVVTMSGEKPKNTISKIVFRVCFQISEYHYRVSHLLMDLTCVDIGLSAPPAFPLAKFPSARAKLAERGTIKFYVNPTLSTSRWHTLCSRVVVISNVTSDVTVILMENKPISR